LILQLTVLEDVLRRIPTLF